MFEYAHTHVFVLGSYDHTVKMFDARTNQSVISVEHGQPVESVLLFPSGGLLVSAGISFKNCFTSIVCLESGISLSVCT